MEIKTTDEAMMTVSEENVGHHGRENASLLRPVNVKSITCKIIRMILIFEKSAQK